jgi:hypothetical protein
MVSYELILSIFKNIPLKDINLFFLQTIIYFTFPVVLIAIENLLPILLEIYKNKKDFKNNEANFRKKNIK